MTKQSFLKGAFILLMASNFGEGPGLRLSDYDYPPHRPEGIGIFNMVFLYILRSSFLQLWDFPAIPKLTAEEIAAGEFSNVEIILGTAASLLFLISAALSFVFILLTLSSLRTLCGPTRPPGLLFLLPTVVLVASLFGN